MISTNDTGLYADALDALKHYAETIPGHKGRFIQLFLAMKFYGSQMPWITSASGIPVGLLQSMLDDLYAKVSRSPTDTVLNLFGASYMPRTGLKVQGAKYGANNWRNNFNLQKGVGCYASAQELSDPLFLAAPRVQCPHLVSAASGTLSGAQCSLNPGPKYRAEGHRKWIQIRPGPPLEYAAADLTHRANFAPYVAPNGARIPALPAVVAVYHDADKGLLTGSRAEIDMPDFQVDFNLSVAEFGEYFDDDPNNAHNANLLQKHAGVTSYARVGAAPLVPARYGLPGRARRTPRPATPVPPALSSGTVVAPPATNSGFDAQAYVKEALSQQGFTVYDVSNQRVGYDLHAVSGSRTRYVEVKSSIGPCTPTLTEREYVTAKHYGVDYVLAIIENFSPRGNNTIHFVVDPAATCAVVSVPTTEYTISRTTWRHLAVPLTSV